MIRSAAKPHLPTLLGLACLAWLMAGCPARQVRPLAPARSAMPGVAGPAALELTFALQRGERPAVRVSLELAGSPTGSTGLRAAERWAGMSDLGDLFTDLRASGPDGPLPIERTAAYRWQLRHRPDARLRIEWTLRASNAVAVHHPSYYYRPIVEPDRFHLIGHAGLLVPEHLADGEAHVIAIHWEGFAEAGWRVACSHGLGQRRVLARRTMDELRHAVFLAGALRLQRRFIHESPLLIALQGRWAFSDAAFVDLAAEIVAAERAFFDQAEARPTLISAISVGRRVPGRIATGGTGLTDSTALFLSPGLDLRPGSRSRLRLALLLAHELFHHWNGHVIQVAEPEELVYWFSEGFTDFYARRLLLRAGVIDVDRYAALVNDTSVRYSTNPRRNAPNRRIQRDFWRDEAVGELPYQRGCLVAHLLDQRIRSRSQGRRSLDDLMRALAAHARRTGQRVDTPQLLARFARATSARFADRLRGIVVDGDSIDLPLDLYAPCLRGETRRIGEYQLGFDRQASLEARRVSGVVRGSAAWRAGLRDGQRLLGWSIHGGRPDKRVELKVQVGEKRIPVSYYPQRDPRPVSWFTPDQRAACRERL